MMKRLSSSRGFTLIELMIALVIGLLAVGAVFSLFVQQSRALQGQQQIGEVQDQARVAMEFLERDIRNSGFLTPLGGGLRIENNCAISKLSLSGTSWVIGGGAGTAVLDSGNNIATTWGAGGQGNSTNGKDQCPNGSDRITVVTRQMSDSVTGCNGANNCTGNDGTQTSYSLPCDFCNGTACVAGDQTGCRATLEKVCPSCGVQACAAAGVYTFPNSPPATLPPALNVCNDNDASKCELLSLTDANCQTDHVTVHINYPGATGWAVGDWTYLGGGSDSIGFNGFVTRTYQILDIDGDGSPELVYSDSFGPLLGALGNKNGTLQDPNWTVVAYGIEDLQFAFAFRGNPTRFFGSSSDPGISLWETTGCTVGGLIDCLQTHIGANDPPVAIRVSIVARGSKIQTNTNDVKIIGGRPALEDNPGNPASTGYRRRTITTIVGLRNFSAS